MKNNILTWLSPLIDAARASAEQGRSAHALLISGAVGTGKRVAAAWLAARHLALAGEDSLPQYPALVPEHADLRWIRPLEDKHTIGIDQIRALVNELSLTSYTGRGKVAIIEPANAMTVSAANSLLKTLEEPPGNALLILVADRQGRLPATIVSRCQRLHVNAPSTEDGIGWLDCACPGQNWSKILREAGNAPLAALAAYERQDETDGMGLDFAAVAEGVKKPLQVAANWAKYEPEFVLSWMGRQIMSCILRVSGGAPRGVSTIISDSVLRRVDRRNLFCYLDIINRLRSQPVGSFNVQLTLECLLIDWAGGLRTVMDNE